MWFADATNGITDFFARRGHFEEICAKNSDGTETCFGGDQLKSLLGSEAAGTPNLLSEQEAPSGSSAEGASNADTATTTTPSANEPASSAPEVSGTKGAGGLIRYAGMERGQRHK